MERLSTTTRLAKEKKMEVRKKAEELQTNQDNSKALVDHRAMDRRKICEPSFYDAVGKESFYFVGHNICIQESMDVFGALIWPGAIALCQFLENNQQEMNLKDKAVLEIGAGTGLLSVVASLLGASVTATDLTDLLPNLTFNLLHNTKGRSRYTPRVAVLSWGQHLDQDFPYPSHSYDYVLAADVVYHHNCLEDLLKTMHHFCRPGSQTTLLWANKVRFQSDVWFAESFRSNFNATLLAELPEQEAKTYHGREGLDSEGTARFHTVNTYRGRGYLAVISALWQGWNPCKDCPQIWGLYHDSWCQGLVALSVAQPTQPVEKHGLLCSCSA